MVYTSMPEIDEPILRSEVNLDLELISTIQGIRTIDLTSPQMHIDTAQLSQRKTQVVVDENIMQVSVKGMIMRMSEREKLDDDRKWKEYINHLRHDYVGSMLRSETDADLSDIGISSKLTPDHLSSNRRVVIELTTNASDEDKSMERSYKKKILAYKDLLEGKGVFYCIIVVSPNKVLSNAYLRKDMISELCRRCREGISMETEAEKQLGYEINSGESDDDHDSQLVKDSLLLIEKMQRPFDWDFNQDLTEISLSPSSESESLRVREILDDTWKKAYTMEGKMPHDSIEKKHESMRVKETRSDKKRVFTFPAVTPKFTNEICDSFDIDLNAREEGNDEGVDAFVKLWHAGLSNARVEGSKNPLNVHYVNSLAEALTSTTVTEKHNLRNVYEFQDSLSRSEMDKIALSGPGAKLRKEMKEFVEHEIHQKKGFDPETDASDVETFIKSQVLEDHDECLNEKSAVLNMIRRSPVKMSKRKIPQKLMDWITGSGLVRYSSFISELCSELSYEYKVPHKEGRWTCKPMRNYPVMLLIRSTGSHIFFSIACKINDCQNWDTGRLGAKMWKIGDVLISDFCSLVEASLEHFVKAGPYIASITAYLMQHFSLPFLTSKIEFPDEYWNTLKGMFLIYMNNKNDIEDMVMNMRYLYMRVLQKYENDPYVYLDRLPSVLRSRLSCYFLRRIEWIMKFYRSRKPKQVKVHGVPESDPNSVRYTGLRCIFHDMPLTLPQLVDSFYFSYTVSKFKGRVGDRSFKITKKIVQEEMWARENIPSEDGFLWNDIGAPLRQKWSPSLMKAAIDTCSIKWKKLFGDNYVDQIRSKIVKDFAHRKFSEVATLKASSKNHENPQINLPKVELGELTGREYVKALKELNPKLQGKRPRVISSLLELIKDYMRETGDSNPTLIKLLPFSLRQLIARGYIYSDCFDKDQHGGVREIHVLEIRARIVQFFVERIARTMNNLFKTDSILNPKYKDSFMRDHEITAQANLGDHMTMCKSADASKWCQRHHVSKFYFLMNRITGGFFSGLLYLAFFLWTVKRIALPDEMIGILHTSDFSSSDNTTLNWLRSKFLTGTTPFVCEDSNTIEVKFGMGQGLWHFVSTVMQSTFQNASADWMRAVLEIRHIPATVSVIQGSDDSACVISYNKTDKFTSYIVYSLLKWKEIFQKYVSIWPSEAKSSIGTLLLVEYNSEWWYRGKVLKPTFRWVSACLETTIVEMFYERMQIYYSQLSTAVETGVCTLTACVIQRCQAWLHYNIMGLNNHVLRDFAIQRILTILSPAIGYFPLDTEINCGITGFDYSLYVLNKEHSLRLTSYEQEMINPAITLDYDDKIDKSLRRDMRTVSLKFGDKKIWERIKEEMDIGELEDALMQIKEDPSCLYEERSGWEDQKLRMLLKIFESGVKASLSSYQPTIRSMVSSSYLLNRPCLAVRDISQGSSPVSKISLVQLLVRMGSAGDDKDLEQDVQSEQTLQDVIPKFVNESEYEDFYSYVDKVLDGFTFQEVPFGRHSKVQIPVWGEMFLHDTPLYDIIRRGLFHMRTVSVSQTVFDLIWSECKAKYRFLRDNYMDTLIASGMDDVTLHDFFLSASGKTRKVTLQDTTVKSPDILSAMTRVYWPQVKIRTRTLSIDESLRITRHMALCITSFFFSSEHKLNLLKGLGRISGLINTKLANVPVRARKFKVMLDYMLNRDKKHALRDIPLIKMGVVGFFLKKQDTMISSTGRVRYTGDGIWVGQVCGISVKLNINALELRKITINSLQDTVNLSKRLSILMRDLKLTAPRVPERSSSLYYLNSKGHLGVSPLAIAECVPIEIDTTLVISELDNILDKEWKFMIDGTTLRLCSIEFDSSGREFFVTLLSDTFSSRDWNPSLSPQDMSWTKSRIFPAFCRGDPIKPLDMLEELKIFPDGQYMQNLLSRTTEADVLLGKYSLKQLGECLRKRVVLTRAKKDQRDAFMTNLMNDYKESLETTDVLPEEMEEMLNFDSPMEGPTGKIGTWASSMSREDVDKESWADIMIMDSEGALDSDDIEDSEWLMEDSILEEISSLLFHADLEEMNINYLEFDLLREMPLENNFWDDIIRMTESEESGNKILEKIITSDMPSDDCHLLSQSAFYMSLASRKNLYPIQSSQMSSDQETHLSREVSEKIYSKEEMGDKIQKLEVEISEITDVLPSLSGAPKRILENKLKDMNLQLTGLRNVSGDVIMSELNYWSFMDTIIRTLKEEEIWDKSDQSGELETLTTLLLSNCLENSLQNNRMKLISANELNSIRTRIWDKNVGTSLMRFISSSFNLESTFLVNNKAVFSFSPKFMSKEVTFKFFHKD